MTIESASTSLCPTEPNFTESDKTELHSASWNQDFDCFSAGIGHGFRIYNCHPFKETFRRDLRGGKFKMVEMLYKSNVLGLVGTKAKANNVVIWDDHQTRFISEFSFRSEVRGVRLARGVVVIVLERMVYVYDFGDLRLVRRIDTVGNSRGLCALSNGLGACVLACPGLKNGQVRVEHFGLNLVRMICAHESMIACLTLTADGLILATGSARGTLIRIFNTMDGTLLQEVRRGLDTADIYSIALSSDVRFMAVSSDKGTVHVFGLRVWVLGDDSTSAGSAAANSPMSFNPNLPDSLDSLISQSNGAANPGSSFSFMKRVLPKYFSSEWSFARFHLPECSTRCIVAFGSNNTVLIVGMDGSFYRCIFDLVNGGDMVQQERVDFLKP